MNALLAWDTAALGWLHDCFSSPLLDRLMPVITHFGDGGILWLLLASVLLARRDTRRAGMLVLASMVICLVVGNGILKPLVARPRPFVADPSILLLVSPPLDPFSFPSGHTMHSFAAACALGFSGRRGLFYPALLLAVLIGFSRVYLMVHYPFDALAGALLGVCGAFFASRMVPSLEKFIQKRKKSAF